MSGSGFLFPTECPWGQVFIGGSALLRLQNFGEWMIWLLWMVLWYVPQASKTLFHGQASNQLVYCKMKVGLYFFKIFFSFPRPGLLFAA